MVRGDTLMMTVLISIPFYLATACYVAAAAMSILFARGAPEELLTRAKRTAAAGNVLLVCVLASRWWYWGLLPLTGITDSLNLFLIFCTGIVLILQRNETMKPLLVFYLPALAILSLISASVAHQHLGESPKDLNSLFLTVHVGLVFFAFSLFFVASLTSMSYMFKARNLKSRTTTGLFQKLPSLEQLDRTLYVLIAVGYPTFVVTFILGFIWAWYDRELLGPRWFVSPKILNSFAIAVLYAVSFYTRRFRILRGPKWAYLVFYGFTGVFATYLILNLLDLAKGSFWGAPS